MKAIARTLKALEAGGNLRHIPDQGNGRAIDLSSNDYLGIGADSDLRRDFLRTLTADTFLMTSSASRLLAAPQRDYQRLEEFLEKLYGRPALLFNSGYHANTGMVGALGGKDVLFLADKLVHASIIDGLMLAGSDFKRFRHNDLAHLSTLLSKYGPAYSRVVIVTESVYSMDGDRCDIDGLIDAKKLHPDVLLYIDEAHAVGVCGPQGLGLAAGRDGVDILVGTLGKALASAGAFAILSPLLRQFMVNRCRSLIFSTAIPPVQAAWSMVTIRRALEMDAERQRLRDIAARLAQALSTAERPASPSHIMPYIVGDAARTVSLSAQLLEQGVKVLPIRTPTVPAGTERLRISLSAALTPQQTEHAAAVFLTLTAKV